MPFCHVSSLRVDCVRRNPILRQNYNNAMKSLSARRGQLKDKTKFLIKLFVIFEPKTTEKHVAGAWQLLCEWLSAPD